MIFRDSYNWILRIQKKIDTKASIYVMFRNCARSERNVFVTREECDVDEQDVDEKKECWERKRVLSHIWVISESYLSQTWCELIRASALFSLNTLVTIVFINFMSLFLNDDAFDMNHHQINVCIKQNVNENFTIKVIMQKSNVLTFHEWNYKDFNDFL